MKRINKIFSILLLLSLLLTSMSFLSFADIEAPKKEGISTNGVISKGENKDIKVLEENIVFEVNDLLKVDGEEPKKSTVTLKYIFENKLGESQKITLLYPVGNLGSYDEGAEELLKNTAEIKIGDKVIPYKKRYSYKTDNAFDLQSDKKALSDDYISTDAISKEMKVVHYKYSLENIDLKTYPEAIINLTLPKNETCFYYVPNTVIYERVDVDTAKVSLRANYIGDSLDFYILTREEGTNKNFPKISVQLDSKNTLKEELKLSEKVEMKMLDFVLSSKPKNSDISDIDWYNITLSDILKSVETHDFPIFDLNLTKSGYRSQVMTWLEYDLILEGGGRVENLLTLPLFPTVDFSYEPNLFTYKYDYSTAKTWTDYGTLKITANSPYFFMGMLPENSEKIDTGYTFAYKNLPENDFEFNICTSQHPSINGKKYVAPVQTLYIVLPIVAFLGVGAFMFFYLGKKRNEQ